MAKRHPTIIRPFPDHIDRDGFGHWLSGFVDGEGCFRLAYRNDPHSSATVRSAIFTIALRRDDEPVLELIQSYWQCGNLYRRKHSTIGHPVSDYHVAITEDLANVLVPHFDRYPLHAKKRRDFEIWRLAVHLTLAVKRRRRLLISWRGGTYPAWSEAEHREFLGYVEALRQTRRFDSGAVALPDPAPPDTSQSLLF